MSRYGKVGRFGQVAHPRIRGSLSPISGSRRYRGDHLPTTNPEMAANYFVPSFSIRRHLDKSEEDYWGEKSRKIGGLLGRRFEVMGPDNLTIKTIEQKNLIHKIRCANIQPNAEEMHDLASGLQDSLNYALSSAPESMWVGLGNLAIFGRNKNKLAFTLKGWRGWRANYPDEKESGEGLRTMSPLGALLLETQVAVGNIASTFPDADFSFNDLASSPHITIARSKDTIHDYELRGLQAQINKLGIDSLEFGDPVISYKPRPAEESQVFLVRHAWRTLAEMPTGYQEPPDDLAPQSYEVSWRSLQNMEYAV